MDDFFVLTLNEFQAVHEPYVDVETERLHGDLERMRMLATISV